ncbi:hypothetical protein Plec18170_006519 [Paecilomyces lecythidis]
MGSTSVIPSLSGKSCTSKPQIPVILLDSDDEDVEIVEVRSVQKGCSHERATSSGSGTSGAGAGAHRESTSTSSPPSLKRELEQAEEAEAKTKSPHPKRQRSESEDDSHLIPCFSPITTGHFDYEVEPSGLDKLEKAPASEDQGPHPEEHREDDKAPSPYTKEFFIDLADTISNLFPVDSFAAQHGCSSAEVSRAISALVVSPLMDPALYEKVSGGEYSSIEDYGRMMIGIWTDRYRKMVNDENGSADNDSDSGSSGRALASIKRRSEPQEDAVKMDARHLVMSGVRSSMEGHEPGVEEESVSARHWVERDSFGIYVESEPSVEESGSLLFVEM